MTRDWRRGLYAITDTALIPAETLTERVAEAIAGGAALIQYRDKYSDRQEQRERADALLTLCREHGVPLLINDDVALAVEIGADGVHLGGDDESITIARAQLGPRAIIGASCYDQLPRAVAAAKAGADYVAFGRFFPSRTKPQAVQADVDLLRSARKSLSVPVAAIGGITPENGDTLIAAGADLLAVIHGVFGQPNVESAAASIAGLFNFTQRRQAAEKSNLFI